MIPAIAPAVSSLLFLGLFLYPYLLYPLLLRALPQKAVHRGRVGHSASLLFCAYNEAPSLEKKMANLRTLKRLRPTLQILAYDDCSTDGTTDLLDSDPNLLTLVRGSERTGKAAGMKRLAAMAEGDVLIFTDANVILAPDAVERLLAYFADPAVGGVCGKLVYSADPESLTAAVGSFYWRLDERLRTLESRTGNVTGGDGSIFAVRKSLYPDFPDSVLDDLTVSMQVLFAGSRLVKAPDVLAFESSVARRDEELRRKVRIGTRAYHTHLYLRPRLRELPWIDRFKYASRKQMRWFGGLFLGLSALSGLGALALLRPLAAAVALGLFALIFAFALRLSTGRLGGAAEALLATFAVQLGVFRAIRGKSQTLWTPAQSR